MLTRKPLLHCTSYSSSLVFQYWLETSKGSRKEKQHILYRHLLIVTMNPLFLLPSIYSPHPTVMLSFKMSNFLFIVSSSTAFLCSLLLWKIYFLYSYIFIWPFKTGICLPKRLFHRQRDFRGSNFKIVVSLLLLFHEHLIWSDPFYMLNNSTFFLINCLCLSYVPLLWILSIPCSNDWLFLPYSHYQSQLLPHVSISKSCTVFITS